MTRRQIAFILGMLGFFLVFCTLDNEGPFWPILCCQLTGLACFMVAIYLGGGYER
jgi:hypothetical protein